jgi:hypothetical protein
MSAPALCNGLPQNEYQRRRRAARINAATSGWKPWTTAEIRQAEEMRARGKSYAQIAMKIGRTQDAVAAQLRVRRLREGRA